MLPVNQDTNITKGVNSPPHLPITEWENASKHVAITLTAIAAIALVVTALAALNWQGFMTISTPIGAFSSNAAFWTMVGAAGLCVATAAGGVTGFIHHTKQQHGYSQIHH